LSNARSPKSGYRFSDKDHAKAKKPEQDRAPRT
jgi:hypothetical protein